MSSLRDLTTWERALYLGPGTFRRASSASSRAWYPRSPASRSARQHRPIPDFGLGLFQITTAQTGTAWYYEGGTLGYRVEHFYFPRSGIIIAIATNSATNPDTNDWLQATAIRVYRTLQKAGAVQSG